MLLARHPPPADVQASQAQDFNPCPSPPPRKASSLAHLMPSVKNAARKPPGAARLQWLYAPLPLLVKQMVACTGSSPFPCPISCCPTHTGHVGRQHLHPDSFCCVSHFLCDCIMHVEPSHKAQMLSLSENRDSFYLATAENL